jgi:hypothetical protein
MVVARLDYTEARGQPYASGAVTEVVEGPGARFTGADSYGVVWARFVLRCASM